MKNACSLGIGALLVATLGTLVSACGEGDSGATAVSPEAGAVGTGTLRVLVVDPPRLGPFKNRPPVANALVVIAKPGGAQEEATTGADGKVTFTGIDWASGTASVVAYADGRALSGVSDVSPATFKSLYDGMIPQVTDADVVLAPLLRQPLPSTKLDISITNKAGAGNNVFISATTARVTSLGNAIFESTGSQGTLGVAPDLPFTLVVSESSFTPLAPNLREFDGASVRWARFDQPAPTTPLSLDIGTGGTTLTPATAKVRVVIPGGAQGPLGAGQFGGRVTSVESELIMILGNTVVKKLSADKAAFDLTFSSVVLAGQTPASVYVLFVEGGIESVRLLTRAPQDGETLDNFLLPIDAPATQSLADPIPLAGADPAAVSRLAGTDLAGEPLFLIDAPPGTKTMHLPKLPAVAQALLKSGPGKARLLSLRDVDPTTTFYLRYAVSRPFPLVAP